MLHGALRMPFQKTWHPGWSQSPRRPDSVHSCFRNIIMVGISIYLVFFD